MEIMSASDSCRVRCRTGIRHDVCCLVAETKRARDRRRSVQRGDARDSQRAGSRHRANDGDGVRADRPQRHVATQRERTCYRNIRSCGHVAVDCDDVS